MVNSSTPAIVTSIFRGIQKKPVERLVRKAEGFIDQRLKRIVN